MQTRKSLTLVRVLALAAAIAAPAAASLVVSPNSQTINVGGSASVNIDISGLGNGISPALAGYTGLLIGYDSSILDPSGVTFSNRLGDPTDPSQTLLLVDLFLPSLIQLDGFSFLSAADLFAAQANPNGAFTIATITFNGIAGGTSAIDVTYGSLSDENGNALIEDSINGSITVQQASGTPEPGTFALLAAGIAGIAALRRRRRA